MTGRVFFERIFSNWIIKILSVAAAVVLFLFQRIGSIEERFISVPLEFEVHDEFVVTNVSTDSVRIDIRGGGDEIFLVLGEDIRAYVDLTSYTTEGIFKAPIFLEKTGSAQTVNVEMIVEPLEVTVTLERKVERELAVVPDLLGYPAVGYELVQYLVTPETVNVTGPRSSLSGLERLRTAEIDLSGRTSDFTMSVPVQTADELIVFSGSRTVEVRGFIREVIVEKTFGTVSIEYVDLASRLELEEAVVFGSLRLSGPQLSIESLRVPDLGLVADCGAIASPGVYELPVTARTPPGITPVAIQPSIVEVRVTEAIEEEAGGSDSPRAGPAEAEDTAEAAAARIESESAPQTDLPGEEETR